MGRDLHGDAAACALEIPLLPQVAYVRLKIGRPAKSVPAGDDAAPLCAAIEKHHRLTAARQRPDPDLRIAPLDGASALDAQGILIDGNDLAVGQDRGYADKSGTFIG